jgi:hypothetical protein
MQKRWLVFICLLLLPLGMIRCNSQKQSVEEGMPTKQTQSFSIESIHTSTQLLNAKESIYELQYTCLLLNTDLQDSMILTVTPILKSDFKPYVIEEKPLSLEINQLIRNQEKITIQGKMKYQAKKISEDTQKTWSPYIMGLKILNEKSVLVESKP